MKKPNNNDVVAIFVEWFVSINQWYLKLILLHVNAVERKNYLLAKHST